MNERLTFGIVGGYCATGRAAAFEIWKFGAGDIVIGGIDRRLVPGEDTIDIVTFDEPPAYICYLRIQLPGSYFGGTGQLRYYVPQQMLASFHARSAGSNPVSDLRKALGA